MLYVCACVYACVVCTCYACLNLCMCVRKCVHVCVYVCVYMCHVYVYLCPEHKFITFLAITNHGCMRLETKSTITSFTVLPYIS